MTSSFISICSSISFFNSQRLGTFQSVHGRQAQQHCSRTAISIPVLASAVSRRQLLKSASAILIASLLTQNPCTPAQATSGLHLFPLTEPLTNSYYLMRACETVSDKLNVMNTNPVNKLSIQLHGLTRDGVEQAYLASSALSNAGVGSDAWIWPSVTFSTLETAEILAYNLKVRREQIVPEFSFLDMRGVGIFEGGKAADVHGKIADHDRLDSNWRPAPTDDGTPNDSTEDVFVRVRQLISKLETLYVGENIIVLSPDSDALSVLQAAIMGKDLRLHHMFDYQPGEVRFVRELVVDQFGKTIVEPSVRIICKPQKVKVST